MRVRLTLDWPLVVSLVVQLAAQRFVYYWEARRSVFGEGKFTLPLTLSEALRDDFAAIEAGVYCLLPHKDLSGRQLIYLEPHRHTGEGYTSESLVSTQDLTIPLQLLFQCRLTNQFVCSHVMKSFVPFGIPLKSHRKTIQTLAVVSPTLFGTSFPRCETLIATFGMGTFGTCRVLGQ